MTNFPQTMRLLINKDPEDVNRNPPSRYNLIKGLFTFVNIILHEVFPTCLNFILSELSAFGWA